MLVTAYDFNRFIDKISILSFGGNEGLMNRKSNRRSEFGILVKTELIRQGMTSRQLARAIGVADSTLCDVIAGRNKSEATKQRILDVLEQWREEEKANDR